MEAKDHKYEDKKQWSIRVLKSIRHGKNARQGKGSEVREKEKTFVEQEDERLGSKKERELLEGKGWGFLAVFDGKQAQTGAGHALLGIRSKQEVWVHEKNEDRKS